MLNPRDLLNDLVNQPVINCDRFAGTGNSSRLNVTEVSAGAADQAHAIIHPSSQSLVDFRPDTLDRQLFDDFVQAKHLPRDSRQWTEENLRLFLCANAVKSSLKFRTKTVTNTTQIDEKSGKKLNKNLNDVLWKYVLQLLPNYEKRDGKVMREALKFVLDLGVDADSNTEIKKVLIKRDRRCYFNVEYQDHVIEKLKVMKIDVKAMTLSIPDKNVIAKLKAYQASLAQLSVREADATSALQRTATNYGLKEGQFIVAPYAKHPLHDGESALVILWFSSKYFVSKHEITPSRMLHVEFSAYELDTKLERMGIRTRTNVSVPFNERVIDVDIPLSLVSLPHRLPEVGVVDLGWARCLYLPTLNTRPAENFDVEGLVKFHVTQPQRIPDDDLKVREGKDSEEEETQPTGVQEPESPQVLVKNELKWIIRKKKMPKAWMQKWPRNNDTATLKLYPHFILEQQPERKAAPYELHVVPLVHLSDAVERDKKFSKSKMSFRTDVYVLHTTRLNRNDKNPVTDRLKLLHWNPVLLAGLHYSDLVLMWAWSKPPTYSLCPVNNFTKGGKNAVLMSEEVLRKWIRDKMTEDDKEKCARAVLAELAEGETIDPSRVWSDFTKYLPPERLNDGDEAKLAEIPYNRSAVDNANAAVDDIDDLFRSDDEETTVVPNQQSDVPRSLAAVVRTSAPDSGRPLMDDLLDTSLNQFVSETEFEEALPEPPGFNVEFSMSPHFVSGVSQPSYDGGRATFDGEQQTWNGPGVTYNAPPDAVMTPTFPYVPSPAIADTRQEYYGYGKALWGQYPEVPYFNPLTGVYSSPNPPVMYTEDVDYHVGQTDTTQVNGALTIGANGHVVDEAMNDDVPDESETHEISDQDYDKFL